MPLRWVHLTDLHVGKPDEARRAALRSLVGALSSVIPGESVDAVFLTGDLAYSGREAEYDELYYTVIDPLRRLPEFSSARFIAVPGNHDIDCDKTLPAPWATLGNRRQQLFFQDTAEGRTTRAARAVGFGDYAAFLSKRSIEGPDPTHSCSAALSLAARDGTQVEIVGVVTAFFSDKEVTDESQAPAPTLPLRTQFDKIEQSARIIVLGHHPPSWFLHTTQEPLRTLLYQRHALYLHGHEHRVRVDSTKNGLRILGFGAAYQAALDDTSPSAYENTFSICYLDTQLHIAPYVWDQSNGAWRRQTKLPGEFDQESKLLRGAYVFSLGLTAPTRQTTQNQGERQRLPPLPTKAYSLDPRPDATIWGWLLRLAGLIPEHSDSKSTITGQHDVIEMIVNSGAATLRFRCIPGHGHVLSAREVEVENTRMDTEGHQSVVLVTFGEIADDARLLGLQLERRKSFRTCSQADLAKLLNARVPREVTEYLEHLDAADVVVAHVLGLQRWFFLIQDRLRSEWFYVIDEKAQRLAASDETVTMLRRQRPELATGRYHESNAVTTPGTGPEKAFDRASYLTKCRQEFHTLKYDALAALGVRFPSASVEHLYVPANADVGDATGSSTAYRQAINDILDSLNLDDVQRAQLEGQLREGMSGVTLKETGAARSLYQQHGNVLVLGDPGSGKTCFLKNEVLSYCDNDESVTSWYKYHIPVFVPLVEAAAITGEPGIIEICAQLASRRGLPLTASQLTDLMTSGHVAFFFDGLDEVPSIEQRAKFVEHVGNLIAQQGPLGNRVVLTSRPAAVHLLKIPRKLVTLHLRGLTDSEMRLLATKVLSVEYAAGDRVRLSAKLPPEEEALLERLLEDCRNNPGIRRIARNPLLLTLLVMIYANSGPLAAKKHRVYSQAVQTLVSVRNRDAKQQVLSEADLRHRLGAVALETYRTLGVEIPTMDWVCAVIARSLQRDASDRAVIDVIEHFVQLVAEATGLLVIHKREEPKRSSTVSFLHHSFLEYYAAVGYIETQQLEHLPKLATHSRWREVITLIAGLLADQSDSTRLIRTLTASIDEGDDITLERFLFAFDCALEADVPTEETQELLVAGVAQAMKGPGIVDPGARKELADRLSRLLGTSGSLRVKILLAAGVRSPRVEEAAAYVELAGRVGKKVDLGGDVVAALTAACGRPQPEIRGAVLGSIERVADLRGSEAIKALREGLQGGIAVRYAAVRTLEAVPALTKECWNHAKACLADSQAAVAGTAARALMAAGIHIDLADRADRGFIELCLRRWARIADAEEAHRNQLKTSREQLDELLSSPMPEDRLLGLRLLPLLVREERYVYDRIFEIVNSDRDRNETVAALEALRLSRGALGLITMADVDSLGSVLESDYRDIRMSAARTLAAHPSPDAVVSRLLREYAQGCKGSELRAAIRALVQVAEDDTASRGYLFSMCNERAAYALEHSFGNEATQRELEVLLQACEELGGEGTRALEDNLAKLADSYRAPKRIRQRALHALARISMPSSSRITYFVKILNGNDPILGPSIGVCIVDFVSSCRQRVDNVRSVVSELGSLDAALVRRWSRIVKSTRQIRFDDQELRGIRDALREVRELVVAYGEFAGHKRIAAG